MTDTRCTVSSHSSRLLASVWMWLLNRCNLTSTKHIYTKFRRLAEYQCYEIYLEDIVHSLLSIIWGIEKDNPDIRREKWIIWTFLWEITLVTITVFLCKKISKYFSITWAFVGSFSQRVFRSILMLLLQVNDRFMGYSCHPFTFLSFQDNK